MTLIPCFNYESVPAEVAGELRTTASTIREQFKITTDAIIAIGEALNKVRRHKLTRRRFTEWVETECGFSMDTAQRYMRVARFVAGKNRTVRLLGPKALYRLSARSTPPTVVTLVLDRIDAGQVPCQREIASLITQHKPSRSSRKEAARANSLIEAWLSATDKEREEFEQFRRSAEGEPQRLPLVEANRPMVAPRGGAGDLVVQVRKTFVEAPEAQIHATPKRRSIVATEVRSTPLAPECEPLPNPSVLEDVDNRAIDLVRDSNQGTLIRPQIDADAGDGLDIPAFLRRTAA
jgi:hypothetical protein